MLDSVLAPTKPQIFQESITTGRPSILLYPFYLKESRETPPPPCVIQSLKGAVKEVGRGERERKRGRARRRSNNCLNTQSMRSEREYVPLRRALNGAQTKKNIWSDGVQEIGGIE